VYVATPNRHLVVRDGCVLASPGPRENRHRPSVDALFRSAARRYRSNLIAVVLSGTLDDGVAGAQAVQVRGGVVLVQDPAEAEFADMPRNVLAKVEASRTMPIRKIASLLRRLASQEQPVHHDSQAECDPALASGTMPIQAPFAYMCPDCGGALIKTSHAGVEQFRCSTGHVFSMDSFSLAHSEALERALWTALQRLNERCTIQEELARTTQDPALQRRYQENAAAAAEDIRLLRQMLAQLN
jgi:two-component system chemotaxis response regulator CheB